MKKRILITAIVFIIVFFAAGAAKIKAGINDDVIGWLWGGSDDGSGISSGVGWISMNNMNPEAFPPGSVAYGVNVPASDGDLSGYAWSENLGYIAFGNTNGYLNGCPDGNCSARRVGNNIQGWARFVDIANANTIGNSGGWLGWIRLNGSNYGVTISADGELGGYAWSDELGWINFSRSAVVCIPKYVNYSCSLVTVGQCDSANYSETITTQSAICSRSDENLCSGDPLPTKQDCADNGIICPADVTITCPDSGVSSGTWKESAP